MTTAWQVFGDFWHKKCWFLWGPFSQRRIAVEQFFQRRIALLGQFAILAFVAARPPVPTLCLISFLLFFSVWSHLILLHLISSYFITLYLILSYAYKNQFLFFCLIFLHFLLFPLIIFVMCFFFILWHLYHHIFSCSDFSWFFLDMTIFSYYLVFFLFDLITNVAHFCTFALNIFIYFFCFAF